MNALTKLIGEAKEEAICDLEHSTNCGRNVLGPHQAGKTGESSPIRLRSGDTLTYVATVGPRGGITIKRRRTAGWVLDHPADFGESSY